MKLSNKPADRFDWTLAFILLLFCIVSLFAIASAQTSGQYGINFVPFKFNGMSSVLLSLPVSCILNQNNIKKSLGISMDLVFSFLSSFILHQAEKVKLAKCKIGVKRWLNLPVIGQIQPSEFIKTFFILGMARLSK